MHKKIIITVLFLLFCATVYGLMPAPIDIPQGPEGVSGAGGAAMPEMREMLIADAPAISAITEITFPGETLAITGEGLAGANLRIWAEGLVFDLEPLRTANNRMQAVVPTEVNSRRVPKSMLMVWPQKGNKVGAPIRVNAPALWWVWPCRVQLKQGNETIRLFGKNLFLEGREPKVIIQHEKGQPQVLQVTAQNPYSLEATLPGDLQLGEYQVWAHNGSGGDLGWSQVARFEVVEPLIIPKEIFYVDDYIGGVSKTNINAVTAAVERAIAAAVANGGGTIQFSEGRYAVNHVVLPEGVPIILRGIGMGEGEPSFAGGEGISGGTIIADQRRSGRSTFIEVLGRGSRVEDMTIMSFGVDNFQQVIDLKGPDQKVQRVRLLRNERHGYFSNIISSTYQGKANQEILDSKIYLIDRGVLIGNNTDFVRIHNNEFRGLYSIGRGTESNAVHNNGGNNLIMENNDFQGLDRTHGRTLGRTYLVAHGGHASESYLANNRSTWVGSHSSAVSMEGNVSEQYLFHLSSTRTRQPFSVVAANEKSITVKTGLTILPDDFGADREWMVYIARGKGVGQWRMVREAVKEASTQRLILDKPWRVIPDTSSIAIIQKPFRNNIVYNNYIDPAPDPSIIEMNHKTVGVYWFYLAFDNITANNEIRNIGTGVAIAAESNFPSGWNVARENKMMNITGFAGGTSPFPVFYNEHFRRAANFSYWATVGNVFRANEGIGADVIGLLGWRYYDRQHLYLPAAESGLMMSIIENNFFKADKGISLSAPSNWALLRNNTYLLDPGEDIVDFIGVGGKDEILDLLISDI